MRQFNTGDELGALSVLDHLRAARDSARQARGNAMSMVFVSCARADLPRVGPLVQALEKHSRSV